MGTNAPGVGNNLNMKLATTLSRILSDDFTSENTFENISVAFAHYFHETEFMVCGEMISFMLRNDDLLPYQHQKAAALYLLYDMFKGAPLHMNPFARMFVGVICSPASKSLKHFVGHVTSLPQSPLMNNFNEVFKKSPKNLMAELSTVPLERVPDSKLFMAGVGK